jgi:hypothetical protein
MVRQSLKSLFVPLVAAIAIAVLAPGGPAHAGANDGFDPSALDEVTQGAKQVPLTEDMINRLIESYPDMREASAKFGSTQLPEHAPAADSGTSDLDAMSPEKRKALEDVASKHGFSSLEEWTTVGSSVVMSYAYAVQGKKPGSLDQAVKLNIEHAKKDPSLSEDEKMKMIEQITQIGAKLARLEPLEQNYELVLKMKDKVTPIMEAR